MGQRMLPRWHSVMPSSVRLVHPKRRLQCPGQYRKGHRANLRLVSAADDTVVGFAKGPVRVTLIAGSSPSPDLWGTAPASSTAGVEDEATKMEQMVLVERAAEDLGQLSPRQCWQRVCKGEGVRRRCFPFLAGQRDLGHDWKKKPAFLTGKLDHRWEMEEGELEVSEGERVVEGVGEEERVVLTPRLVALDCEKDFCST